MRIVGQINGCVISAEVVNQSEGEKRNKIITSMRQKVVTIKILLD